MAVIGLISGTTTAGEAKPAHEDEGEAARAAAGDEARPAREKAPRRRGVRVERGKHDKLARPNGRSGKRAKSPRVRRAQRARDHEPARDDKSRRDDAHDAYADEPIVVYVRDERRADEPAAQAPETQDEPMRNPDWALAAGVSSGTLVGLGAGPSVGGPGGSVLIERRVHQHLWLLGELGGSYTINAGEAQGGAQYDHVSDYASLHGSAGARFVFTPDQPLRISTYLVATAGYGYGDHRSESIQGNVRTSTSRSRTFGGRLGVTIEHALTDRMSLGVSSDLLQAGAHQSLQETFEDGLLVSGWSTNDGYGGVVLRPMVQMRFFF